MIIPRVLVLLAVSALAGCAITPTVRQVQRDNTDLLQKGQEQLRQAREAAENNASAQLPTPPTFWLGARPIADRERALSPTTRRDVVLKETYGTLADVADALSRDLGVPTRITRDPIPNANQPITLNHDGELADALDTIANRYNLFWSESMGTILFSITQTRTFRIKGLPAQAASNISVSGDQSSGGSGGGGGGTGGGSGGQTGSQSATFTANALDSFRAIEVSVQSMLSPVGKLVSSPAGGTLVVSDVPEKLTVIEKFVDEQNNFLSTKVFVDFRAVLVTQKDSSQFGLDWNVIFNNVNRRYNLGLLAPSAVTTTAGLSMIIPANAPGRAAEFSGSQALLKALEQYATVTQLTSAPLLTLNNKPVQFRRGRTLSYVTAGTTQTPNVGSTTQSTLNRERLGFSVNILPNAQPAGQIFMQTAISVKLLNQLRNIQQGQGASQTVSEAPDTDDIDFASQSVSQHGDTSVLAGIEQVAGTSNQQGLGFAANSLAGGETGTRTRDLILFMITTRVVK
jgi:type IVB pilus formation R64 PilN family outer membrane protein